MIDADRERFKLLELLGAGTFAQTYLTRVIDPYLVRCWQTDRVAIKVPRDAEKEQQLAQDIGMLLYLQREPVILSCDHIVRYRGIAAYANQVVLVMEYVPSGNLRHWMRHIQKESQQPPEKLFRRRLSVAQGIVRGIDALHQIHVVHRDIKPENILMDDDVPKITDFGVSRMLAPDEMAQSVVGAPAYMSPEILFAEASFSTDIWSAGVTLYELFTGIHPFYQRGMTEGKLVLRIRDYEPPPPADISETPSNISDVIMKAIAKDPDDRWTAAELLRALKAVVKGHNGENKDASALEKDDTGLQEALEDVRRLVSEGAAPEKLIDRLKAIIREYPDSPLGYQRLGEMYNRYLRYGEAVKVFQQAIERQPKSGLLHWYLYVAYDKLGDRQEAIQSLRHAVDLGLGGTLQRLATVKLQQLEDRGR